MSSYLLRNTNLTEESTYGALDSYNVSLSNNSYAYSALINTTSVHGVSIFVNLINSAISKYYDDKTITAYQHALPNTETANAEVESTRATMVTVFLIIAWSFIPAYFALFVVREREVLLNYTFSLVLNINN